MALAKKLVWVLRFSVATILLLGWETGAVMADGAGVQQPAAHSANVAGKVTQSGSPVGGADIKLVGPAIFETSSDIRGAFSFTSVPYGPYEIVATTAQYGSTSLKIIVAGDITVAVQFLAVSQAPKTLGRILVSSSGAHVNATPANIASINPSDYAFKGNSSWAQLLNQIPGVTVGGNLGGGNSTSVIIPGSPFQPITLSVNGTLPYETSTTLDGMPLVNTSFSASPGSGVDLAFLPMPSFDTADVVRGPGADAPSIVDSIGGSFVLHAPGFVNKDQVELSASNDSYGGILTNTKAALSMGRLSTTVVYTTNNSPGPLGNANVIPAITTTPMTVNGQPFVSGGFTGFAPNPNFPNCNCEAQNTLLVCCTPVNTGWTQHSGSIGLAGKIAPSVIAQIFYAGSSSRMQQAAFQYPVDFMPGAGYTGHLAAGKYNFISAAAPISIAQSESLTEEKITAYFGSGSVARLEALQNNSFDQQSIPCFCFPNGQYTLFGTGTYGTGSPAVFNGSVANLTFSPSSFSFSGWSNNRDLLASYVAQVGPKFTIGGSYVTSYYNAPFNFDSAFGSFAFSGHQLMAVSESTNEARVNAALIVSDKLSINASWYFTRGKYHLQNPDKPTSWIDTVFPYSAPRLGIVWRANADTSIRAAAGGGFALPQLNNLVGTNGAPDCSSGIFCTVSLTNLNLTPEKSFGFDVGTDIRLNHETILALDVYHSNLYGQLFQSVNITGSIGGLPLYTTQFGNLGQSRFEGLTLDIRRDPASGFYWNGGIGLTRAYMVSVPSGFYDAAGCSKCNNTYIVPGINFDGFFQSTVPYSNGSAQLGYRWPQRKYLDIEATYYGNGNPYFQPAFVGLDAHAGIEVRRNLSFLATLKNITSVHDQNYQLLAPTFLVPTVAGPEPSPLFGIPYGARSLILTADLRY